MLRERKWYCCYRYKKIPIMKKITILIKGRNVYAKIDSFKISLHKSIRKLMIEYHSRINRFYVLLKLLKVGISLWVIIFEIENVTHKNFYPHFTKELALTILKVHQTCLKTKDENQKYKHTTYTLSFTDILIQCATPHQCDWTCY